MNEEKNIHRQKYLKNLKKRFALIPVNLLQHTLKRK